MDAPAKSPAAGGVATAAVSGDSLPRRIGRAVVRTFRPADDVLAVIDSGHALQRPITTGRRIVLTSPRGGADVSVLTTLFAMAFAHYRHDRVLAVDLVPGRGTLALRFGVRPRLSLADLAAGRIEADSFEHLEPSLTPARERVWLLPATGDGDDSAPAPELLPNTVLPLTRFFGVTLVDRGARPSADLDRATLASAHAHVLVEAATREGAASVGWALDRMIADSDESVLARTVVVFVDARPGEDPAFNFAGTAEVLRGGGAEVFRLGPDRHLARTTAIDPRRLAEATRTTTTRVAAETLRRSG
ncbi:MinD/ParA family ATP-binding protein [Marinactinospora rubrisoli]|uniref:MinD/ParA family protein n=1 Tax=Marinactinospora rubrisoli TaxID=2715399 RepID=A0ABW2KKI1_9ACTN